MNSLILYMNESAISIAVLYSVYWFFLRKDTFFILNRIYLVGSVIFSVMLPAIRLNMPFNAENANYGYVLQTITVSKESLVNATSNHLNIMQLLFVVWIAGVAIFFVRFIFQMIQLYRLMKRFGISRHEGLAIVLMDKGFAPFSFFSITFLNRELSDNEFSQIFAHEKIHAKQLHSIDILLIELVTIVQWFNPFVWFIRHSLKAIHEYLADEGVLLKGHRKSDYQELLLSMTLGVRVNELTNNFNYSLIKNRFVMMTKNRSGFMAKFKLLIILPFTAALLVVISCNRTAENQDNNSNKNVLLNENKTVLNDTSAGKLSEKSDNKEIFIEDESPQFPGGNDALMTFISENVKYPESALKAGIQGRVFVSFVVDKSGKVKDAKVLRSVDSELDKEALRVVNMMPDWKNSKHADVVMSLPINFKLS